MRISNLSVLFVFVPVLAVLLLALNILLAPSRPDESKVSPYECGYSPILGQTRTVFHIHFYVVAMLFLIFDLEIILLLPLSNSLIQVGNYGVVIALIFIFVLTIGFIFEISSGELKLSFPKFHSNSSIYSTNSRDAITTKPV